MPFSESIRSWLPSRNDGVLKDINVRMIPISSGDVRGVFSRETRVKPDDSPYLTVTPLAVLISMVANPAVAFTTPLRECIAGCRFSNFRIDSGSQTS